jgi:hypothetical protein
MLLANHRHRIFRQPSICTVYACAACTASTNTIATSSPIIFFIIASTFLSVLRQADNCAGLPNFVINLPTCFVFFPGTLCLADTRQSPWIVADRPGKCPELLKFNRLCLTA